MTEKKKGKMMKVANGNFSTIAYILLKKEKCHVKRELYWYLKI